MEFYILTILDYNFYGYDDHYYIQDDEHIIDIIRVILTRSLISQKHQLEYEECDDEASFDEIRQSLAQTQECKTLQDFNNISHMGIIIKKESFTSYEDISGE